MEILLATAVIGVRNAQDEWKIPILEFSVINDITNQLPTVKINHKHWSLPSNITFADPSFNILSDIDMLIGAEIFIKILKCEQHVGNNGNPLLQNTEFGYIISGKVQHSFLSQRKQHCLHVKDALSSLIKKFWELEENYQEKILPPYELDCENLFKETIRLGIHQVDI